jgi:hypothetical protein
MLTGKDRISRPAPLKYSHTLETHLRCRANKRRP